MNNQSEMDRMIDVVKQAYRIANPWKKREYDSSAFGWNECLKELKKNQKKFIKFLMEKKQEYEQSK